MQIEAHKTAISRKKPSRPILDNEHLITGRILDYGCGRGKDVDYLKEKGFDVTGFDPFYKPINITGKFDTIFCNFVLNVVPYFSDRIAIIETLFSLMKDDGKIIITTRNKKCVSSHVKKSWHEYKDGYITSKNTFQTGIDPQDIVLYFNQSNLLNIGKCEIIKSSGYSCVMITKKR